MSRWAKSEVQICTCMNQRRSLCLHGTSIASRESPPGNSTHIRPSSRCLGNTTGPVIIEDRVRVTSRPCDHAKISSPYSNGTNGSIYRCRCSSEVAVASREILKCQSRTVLETSYPAAHTADVPCRRGLRRGPHTLSCSRTLS